MDLQAQDFAKEHREFLENSRPDVLSALRQSGDLDSYLSSVGEEAEERLANLMHQYNNSPEVQKLPHQERVRALQNRQMEADELVRDELINQPLPSSEDEETQS